MRRLDGVYSLGVVLSSKPVRRVGLFLTLLAVVLGITGSGFLPTLTQSQTGSASAARVWSSGAELNSLTADMEISSSSGTTPTVDSTTKRSGAYAYRANTSSNTATIYKSWASSAQSNKFWFRTYIRIATAPGTEIGVIRIGTTTNNKVGVRMNSDRSIELWNEEDSAQIGSASSALATNTWYRVEVYVNTTTLASTEAELRLDGVKTASTVDSGTINLTAGIDRLTWGILTSTTSDLYFDDIAINDSTGRTDNWPGEGKIVHLNPDANGATNSWSREPTNCNGSSNNYECVDENTPNDATDYIYSSTVNQTNHFDLESTATAGLTSGDYIKLVSVGNRYLRCGGAIGLKDRLIPKAYAQVHLCGGTQTGNSTHRLLIRASSGGSDEESGDISDHQTTSWRTHLDSTTASLYQETLYDLPGTSTAPWTTADLDATQIGVKVTAVAEETQVTALWLLVEYAPNFGGRLFSSGFELNSATAGVEWPTINGSPTISSSTFRSGAYAGRISSLSSGTRQAFGFTFKSANADGPFWLRSYLQITTMPSAENRIIDFRDSGGTARVYLTIDNSGVLKLYDEDSQLTGTSTLSTGTWYRIEVKLDASGTGATDTVEAKVDGAAAFAGAGDRNLTNGVTQFGIGGNLNSEAQTTGDWFYEDVALNENLGSTQNAYPGSGKIIHLKPNATGDNSETWTSAGSGADTNCDAAGDANWNCVKEVTPDDAVTYVEETTTGDYEDFNLDASSVGTSDVVNLVSVGARFRTSSATQEDFKVRVKDTSNAIPIESDTLSPASTTWTSQRTAAPYLYPITAYTRPELGTAWTDTELDATQIGVRDIGGSGTVQVSTLWLLVDYTPAEITISGTCDAFDQTTDCTDVGTVKVAIDGSVQAQEDTTIAGTWDITGVAQPASGAIITVWIDAAASMSDRAGAVTKYDGSGDITGVQLFKEHLTIGSVDNQTVTNTNIGAYDNSVASGDDDVFWEVTVGDDLTVDTEAQSTQEELYIGSGDTFRPASGGGADVTTVHVEIDGTWTADANVATVGGNWQNDSVFSSGTGTVTFNTSATGRTLTGTLNGANGKFYNIDFTTAEGTATDEWEIQAAIEAANDFTLSAGNLDTNNNAVTVTRDLTLTNALNTDFAAGSSTVTVSRHFNDTGDKYTHSTDTLVMAGTGTFTVANNSQFYNVHLGASTFTTTLSLNDWDVNNVLTFNGGTVAGGGGSWIDLHCSTTCTPVSFAAATTLSSTRALSMRANAASTTFTIAGGNYGSWDLLAYATSGNNSAYQLGGNVTTTGVFRLEAADGLTGESFTTTSNNYSLTSLNFVMGPCTPTRTGSWTASFNDSVITITNTGDALYVGTDCGSHTLNLNSSDVTVSGNVKFINGTGTIAVNPGTSDFRFTPPTATVKTYSPNGQALYNVYVNGASSTADIQPDNTVQINNDLTMTNGRLIGTQNVNVNGHVQGTAGIINLTGGTFTQRVSASKNFGTTSGTTAWTFYNLTFSNSHASAGITITTQTGGTGGITVTNLLKIGSSGDAVGATTTLDAGNRIWTLSGNSTTGDPFQILASPAGVLTANTSTFTYTGNFGLGNMTVQTATYYNLDINRNGETFVLEGTTNVGNDLTVTNGTLDTTTSNHAMSITRDVLLANTAGVGFRVRGSTITVSRDWSKGLNATFTRDSSTVQLNGNGQILTVGGGQTQFENLTVAYNTKTTTMATARTDVFGLLTIGDASGGTMTCSVTCEFELFRTSGADLVIGTGATLSGSNATFQLRKTTAATVTVTGATNYGTWNILMRANVTAGGLVTYNVGGNITTSGYMQVKADTLSTATFNTQNYTITADKWVQGDATDTSATTSNWGSSTATFNRASATDTFYVNSNGGAHNVNLQTSSVSVTGHTKFVNGTGTMTVDDGSSTFTFAPTTGTSTYSPNGQTLYNVIVNGAATIQPDAAVAIANDLTMTAGTLNGTQNITVNGNVAGTAGIISLTGGTFEQRVGANKNFGTTSGSTAWTFNDLTFSSSAVLETQQTITTQTGGTGGITVSAVMRVNRATGANDNDGIILTGGNRTWTLPGTSGNPLRMETTDLAGFVGQINPGTSTFTFTGNYPLGNTTVEQNPSGSPTGYYNLDINNSSETLVTEGNTTIGNDLTVTNGVLSTTGSNHSLTVTRDVTLANTAGVGLTGNGSTITVSRNWTDLGAKFTRGTSTVTLNGTGAIDISTGFEFYNLNLAYSTFTTTLPASKTINVENVVTLNGGTLSGNSSTLTPRPRSSSKPLVVNSTTTFTGSGFNIISWTGFNASLTITVDGDNYSHSSWNLFFAGSTNNTTFQLDAALTASTTTRVYAGGAITGTVFNTANNSMTLQGFRLGSGGATQTVSANFGSSTISLTGTGDTIFPESTGGTYNLDLGTSSTTTTGNILFINSSGSIAVTEGTSTVTFTPAASTTKTYSPNGQSLYHGVINGGNDAAEIDLAGNADFNGNLTVSGGRLDTITGTNYSIDAFDVTQSGTAAIKANASTIIVRGNWSGNATWQSNFGTSTVDLRGTTKTITTNSGSSSHFYNLTIAGGASYTEATGSTIFVPNALDIQGTLNTSAACDGSNGIRFTGGTGKNLTIAGTLGGTGCFYVTTATPTYSYTGTISVSNFFYSMTTSTTIPAYTYSGNVYFNPSSGSPTYTIGSGTMTVGSSFNTDSNITGTLTIDNSTNNTNFTVNNRFRTLANAGSVIINLGSATYDVKGYWEDNDSATVNVGTSTVLLSGGSQQIVSKTSGTNTFYNLTVTNASGASASDCERTGFTASVDFANDVTVTNNLTFTTANTRVEFDDGNTYTFANINWNGQAVGTRLYFRNSLASGSWNLNVSGTQTAVSYVNVSRSNASGGNTIGAHNGTNVDCGNNVNWSFANPSSPTNLAQKKTDDTVIATGGWTNETSVKFTADISDGDNPASIQLCVERDILGTVFSNTEDACGTLVAYSGTPVAASVTISVTDTNEYHWQARVKDSGGAYSSWLSYGGNGEAERDFGVDTTACTYAGTVYDGTTEDVDVAFNDSSLSQLSSNWDAFTCTVSGLNKYQYSIGTTVGGTDIKAWTDNSTTESVTASSLNLHTNQRYYFNVRAVDNANNTSNPYSSDGQDVLPSLTFTLGSTTITFSNLNDTNNRTDSKTLALTTSTNAYGGYVIRQYATGVLTNGSFTIPMFQGGTYASPGAWPGGFCTGGSNCGYGYTSDDTTIQGADKFSGGTLYAAFSTTAFGDIVADHTASVTGGTGPVTNEAFTITHKVSVDALQAAKTYQTEVLYIVTGTF